MNSNTRFAIVTFGAAPKQTIFRSKDRAIKTAVGFAQSTAGCGSTVRVIECKSLDDAKRVTISNHPDIGNRVW